MQQLLRSKEKPNGVLINLSLHRVGIGVVILLKLVMLWDIILQKKESMLLN
nr:MAG TPA: hypothetical protein [Bacteriophage sp.]